jgi:hypothetical protein
VPVLGAAIASFDLSEYQHIVYKLPKDTFPSGLLIYYTALLSAGVESDQKLKDIIFSRIGMLKQV